MSFLDTLFSRTRFEKKPRITPSRHKVMERVKDIISLRAYGSNHRRAHDDERTRTLAASEQLEPRIALSVNQFATQEFVENDYGANPITPQPGQVIITSDAGSDVFIQQLDLSPTQLLIADNGSFLEYTAFDNFDERYDDLLVTNGSRMTVADNVVANEWWLFPDRDTDNPEVMKTTRLLLDRANIRVGPSGANNDFYGSVKMLQGNGDVAEWTFSAWVGQGNQQSDYIEITRDGQGNAGDDLYITGGPGFGGRPQSGANQTETPVEGMGQGYIFPRSIRVVTEGDGIGDSEGASNQRTHYLECEWSAVPTSPPVFEANYYGFAHFVDSINNPFINQRFSPATRGVATRSSALVFKLPDAIKGTSPGGSGSLGVVPGTVSGTIEFGVDVEDELIFSNTFQDRRNIAPQHGFIEDTGYSLFYANLDEANAPTPPERQWGKPQAEPNPEDYREVLHAAEQNGQRVLGISGYVRNQSELFMEVGSFSSAQVGYGGSVRPLQGFNVNVTENSLRNGTATEAVRVKGLEYAVFVKPAIPNDVIFAPGATIEKTVTVDLLADDSSIFVNNPIDVNPATPGQPGGDIDFRATNIFINAETTAPEYVFVGRSENPNTDRLPRDIEEGGTRITPTFGTSIPDDVVTANVVATPVIKGDGIDRLVVLPGNEGYGYDPNDIPTVTFADPGVTTADIDIDTISGGVNQLILLGSGGGFGSSEDVEVTFDPPQLRRIASLEQWSTSPNAEGYTAAPVLAISQPEVVNSLVRIGYGERGRSRAAESAGLAFRLASNGKNYASEPNITVQLKQEAKNSGITFYDERIPRDLEWAREPPSITSTMDLNFTLVTSGGGPNTPPTTTANYVSGQVGSITFDSGWGINLKDIDDSTDASFLAGINERFEIVVSGGSALPNLPGVDSYSGWPGAAQRVDATVEFTRPVLGALKWLNVPSTNGQNPEQDARSLLNAGLNYQLSPDVQFITNLTADVPDPIRNPVPHGEDTRELVQPPPVIDDSLAADKTYATHKISLDNVFAYRDDRGADVEGNRFSKTKFRDVDYLSYANDPLHKDHVVAKLSSDGITFYDVLVQPFIGLEDTYTETVSLSESGAKIAVTAETAGKLTVGDWVAGGKNELIDGERVYTDYIPSDTFVEEIYDTTARAGEVTVDAGEVASVDMNDTKADQGQNYPANSRVPVVFSEPEQDPNNEVKVATGWGVTDETGKVISVVIEDKGAGYNTPPTVTLGVPVRLSNSFVGPPSSVDGYEDLVPGSGYEADKDDITITISSPLAPDGTQATGRAVSDSSGVITDIIIEEPGSGYSTPPSIVIDPPANGDGVQATATALISSKNTDLRFYDVSEDGDISKDQLRKLGDVEINTVQFENSIVVPIELALKLGVGDLVVGSTDGVDTDTRVLEVAPILLVDGPVINATVTLSKQFTASSFAQIISFFDVSNKKNVDEYTRQLGVKENPDEDYPEAFDSFINKVTEARIYFHENFEGLELLAAGDAYAVMGRDPAEGRAITSQGEITGIEVTYAGSGYTEVPSVRLDDQEGLVVATVSGGIYELSINNAGFAYQGDTVPGNQTELLRSSELSLFPNSGAFGIENPLVDFGLINSSLQGGNVSRPGEGLVIIENQGEIEKTFPAEGLEIDGQGNSNTEAPMFTAVVNDDGSITTFTKVTSGSGFSIPPTVSVSAPKPAADATARANIDASTGSVSSIDVVDSGNRYFVAPKVVVHPPNPRGEGVAATAVAVLDASGAVDFITVTNGGVGYVNPPQVIIEKRFDYARTEVLDIAANVEAQNYELYLTRNEWTDRERGGLLVRPQAVLGGSGGGRANDIFIEATTADLLVEGDFKAKNISGLMQSESDREMFAPFTVTTRSRATQQQSGTIEADILAFTLGSNIPTPQVGSSITNTFDVQTAIDRLRITAAESVVDPRGAFPYELHVTEKNNLIVDAVPRSGSTISFEVANVLTVESAIQTDGDVEIKATTFSQNSPVITNSGRIAIEADEVEILNSLQVLSRPIDDRTTDISLRATNGPVSLVGLIESPNAIEIFQAGSGGVAGDSRLTSNQLRILADGTIDVATDVHSVVASSENGDLIISEANDADFSRLTAKDGTIQLEALGVDKGRQGENPIALTARILESSSIIVSAPNGSIDLTVDSSEDIDLGVSNPGLSPAVMQAAGNVRIVSAAGSVDVFDGPVAGGSAKEVRVATTKPLPVKHTYQGNTPGAFPSTLSGEGALEAIDGISLDVGDLILVKNQADKAVTKKIDESRENGIYAVTRLGGNAGGYRDWLLTRPNDVDTRAEFLPGSFVSVREGETQSGDVLQTFYPSLSGIQVMRTENSQLTVSGGTGGLLNLDVNDTVSGEGIIAGARVTGVDFVNGVISLGVSNAIVVETDDVDEGPDDTTIIKIRPSVLNTKLLRDAIDSAFTREENILISGPGISVGAQINEVADPFDENNSTYSLSIANEDIDDKEAINSVTIGFASAASGRIVLNPGVRSFLLNSGVESEGNTLTLPSTFTNYGSLHEGQTVFGDGVAPDTIITKVFPGTRRIEVTPSGLPNEVKVNGSVELSDTKSKYFDEGFDEYLQMPDSFNDFNKLSVGQRVVGTGIRTEGGIVTGIDTVYRQIGLIEGSVTSSGDSEDIEFKSIETVDFGMIDKLGSGTVEFSADAFGYSGTQFFSPRVASGLASITDSEFSNEVVVDSLHNAVTGTDLVPGMGVSGVGLHDGHRIQKFDGRKLTLSTADAKSISSLNQKVTQTDEETGQSYDEYRSTIKVDDSFDSFRFLHKKMEVFGSAVNVPGSTSQADVMIGDFDEENRTLRLDSDVQLDESSLLSGYFIFGEIFKPKFLSSGAAKSAISIHALSSQINTFIGSENPRNITRYEVTSAAGGDGPGSLYSLLDIAQNNNFETVVSGVSPNPVITFSDQVEDIRLTKPLPEVTQRPLTIDGQSSFTSLRTREVSVDGRFITEDGVGNAVLADSAINGLVIKGDNASGTIVRGLRLGGFDNASAILVDGASDVLLDQLNVGRSFSNTRSGASYGVYVTGGSKNSTLLDSSVVGATEAAVRVDRDSIGTSIIGTNLGSSDILNKTGVEVVSSGTNLGVLPIQPRVTTGVDLITPKTYEASYRLGSNTIQLESLTSTEWKEFIPGLSVVGVGIDSETVIVSVDRVNKRLVVDKAINRNVLSNGEVRVGHRAIGLGSSTVLNLNNSVPLDRVFLGQTVRVLGAANNIETAKITAIDRLNRTITLDQPLSSQALYTDSTRLVEFVAPNANVIEENSNGALVGLFSNATGFAASDQLNLDPSFSGWQSLVVGSKVFGPGVPVDTVLNDVNEETGVVTLSNQLDSDLESLPVRFEGVNALSVFNTTIRDNVQNGLLIGGGEDHSIGQVKELNVYESRQAAESAKQGNEHVLELVSWRTISNLTAGGELNLSDSRVSDAFLNIVTMATNANTITNAGETTFNVGTDVASVLQPGFAVIGRGIDFDTEVVSVVGNVVTVSQPMTQTFNEGVDVRFLDETHAALKEVHLYGAEGLGSDCEVERFDADLQRVIVSTRGSDLENIEFYFGLNKFVVADPSDPALLPGLHVEGELLIEANDASGTKDETELDLGSGFNKWSQLSYGLSVVGPSIPRGTIVTSWDESTGTLTLSNQLTGDLANGYVTFESRVPEYTVIDTVRAEFQDGDNPVPGYLALNTPTEAEPNPLLVGQSALDEIRVIRRDGSSNSVSANGSFGFTVASTEYSTEVYGDSLATWAVAGNYLNLDLNRATSSLVLRQNLAGAIPPGIFAELSTDLGRDVLFSEFSKTDRYGNQYERPLLVESGDTGGDFIEEDDDDDDGSFVPPDVSTPIDEGDAPEPEDEIWPGSPF